MRKSKNILLLIMFLLFGVVSFGQFSLAGNGVTIECPTAAPNATGVVGGKTYTALTSTTLKDKSKDDVDWDCVCTSLVDNMDGLFENATTFNQDISSWDTSNVIRMNTMFKNATAFNQNIGSWTVSKVQYMGSMFRGASNFNQDIGGWNTVNVTSMAYMFSETPFNQDIGSWNTSKNRNMYRMFYGASAFDNNGQPLNWDTSKVTSMIGTFRNATVFNRNISSWNTSSVTLMTEMFFNADAFNQNIGSWTVSNVTDMKQMFKDASVFNQDISPWDTSSVTTMRQMFENASNFNQNIGSWTVSNVTDMRQMFDNAEDFNQNLNSWDTSKVTNMSFMFQDAKVFNGIISSWNTTSVTTMDSMFERALVFNQDIGSWTTSNVTTMYDMFKSAKRFNQDIGGWSTSSVTLMVGMFKDAEDFNQDIGGWDVSNVEEMRAMFKEAESFNQDIGDWDVSKVTDMFGMFRQASDFNQDLNWDTSSVTGNGMKEMFLGASSFNGKFNVSTWDVSKITTMDQMFNGASAFNQDIGGWNTSSVTTMEYMFRNTNSFNQDIGEWDVSNVTNMGNMFWISNGGSESFSQDLSSWCVDNIGSEPSNFNTNTPNASIDDHDPNWGEPCSPRVILNHSDADNKLYAGESSTISVTFNQNMNNTPQYSLNGGAFQNLTPTGDQKKWTFPISADAISDGEYIFTVSGTAIIRSEIYNPSLGILDGGETSVDSITFEIIKVATITISNVTKFYGEDDFTLTATSDSTGGYTFEALTGGIVNITGSNVSILGVGTTIVSVTQAADGNYNQGSTTFTITVLPGNPIIEAEDITVNYGESDFTLTATSGSTGAYTFEALTGGIVNITGSNASILGIGTTTVSVTQAADANYNQATTTFTITVLKGNPIIESEDITVTFGDPDFTLTATSSSTGGYTFEALTGGIVNITGSNASILGIGTTTVSVTQASDANYNQANTTFTITVLPADPIIEVEDITVTYGDPDFTLTATSSSTGGYTFAALTGGIVNITGSNASIAGAGSTTILVTQAADADYNQGSTTFTITVLPADLIIEAEDITVTFGDPDFTLTATSSSTGGYTFAALTGGIVNITGSNASILEGGTTTIEVTQAADANYNEATTTFTITVLPADLIIEAEDITVTYGDPDFTLTATSSSTGGYTFTALTGGIVNITGSNASIAGAGSTTILVTQAADTNYNSATTTFTITVLPADPIIDVEDILKTCGDPDFALTATSSSTGGYTFYSSDPSVVSVDGSGTATINSSGITIINIVQSAGVNYNSSTTSFTITVNKLNTDIIISDEIVKSYGDADFTLTATSSSSAFFAYTITDTDVATISGTTVTIKGVGSTSILIEQPIDFCYSSSSKTITLKVIKTNHEPTWTSSITKIFGSPEFIVDPPTTNEDYTGDITYFSSDPGIASIDPTTGEVTINSVGTGSVILTANFSEDDNYNSALVTTTLFVVRANQSIWVSEIPTNQPLKDFSELPISAIATPSGAPVYITLSGGSAATLSGTLGNYKLVSINMTGLVTITFFTKAADHPNYNSAELVFVMDVVKLNQNITIDPSPPLFINYSEDLSYTINASSDSGLEVNYKLISGSGVSLTDNVLNISDVGEIIVDVEQPGNVEYNMAATRRVIINVLPAITILSDFDIPDKSFGETSVIITPPKSNRSGEIYYISSNPLVAEVIDGELIIKGLGSCIITAIQSATKKYTQGVISTLFFMGDSDNDGDGIGDSIDNCYGISNSDQSDIDRDGVGDVCDLDADNDGWLNQVEIDCGSDPLDIDSRPLDTDADGKANCTDLDDDGDGWSDQIEIDCGSDSLKPWIVPIDTDGDGQANCEDIDDDGDGWSDNDEITCNSDPLDLNSFPLDTDSDGQANCIDIDDDNDGWTDEQETSCGSDPLKSWSYPIDTDNDGESNCVDLDDDGDGWSDQVESECNTDPLNVFDFPVDRDNDGDPICTDPDDNQVFVSPVLTPRVVGPEATWKIINLEQYPTSIVSVYNRYGLVVFEKRNYQNDWAGIYQKTGELLPAGSYYYIVKVLETGKIKKGWFYLTY